MAEALGHKWGQIIGEVLERSIKESLAARKTKRLSWTDRYGNSHDLDYVLEREGTPNRIGEPVAFIEMAWRRYTKHSKNKAQEIEGALIPLRDTYSAHGPFLGAILAGVFTASAIAQLKSRGFAVLWIDYDTIIAAFKTVGIDAAFDEKTTEAEFRRKLDVWSKLGTESRASVGTALLARAKRELKIFLSELEDRITRKVTSVRIWALHGDARDVKSIVDAIQFVTKYADAAGTETKVDRYEIQVNYSSGDRIEGVFRKKADAVRFLQRLEREA